MTVRILDPDELRPSDDLATARRHIAACDVPGAAAARDDVLRFVDAHPDALHRTCAPGHLTGSALVYDPQREQFLLLHHTKLRKWLQPGGHADGDANLPAVALREATEETGIDGLVVVAPAIDVDIHLVEPPKEHPHLHHDVRYLVLVPPGAAAVGNHESTALRWCRVDDLAELGCDDSVRRLVEAGTAAARALP
jgi:8-oxo-dGTP pyrophosphatase MutT (NUDIX family)